MTIRGKELTSDAFTTTATDKDLEAYDSDWAYSSVPSSPSITVFEATDDIGAGTASDQYSLAVWLGTEDWNNDQFAELTYTTEDTTSSSFYFGPTVRATINGSGYSALIEYGGDSNLVRFDSGVPTVLAAGSHAARAADVAHVEAEGTTINYYVNDTDEQLSVTDSTYSTGQPGIAIYGDTSSPGRADDFSAGNIGTQVTSDDFTSSVDRPLDVGEFTEVVTDDFATGSTQGIESYSADWEYVDNTAADDMEVQSGAGSIKPKNSYDTVARWAGAGSFDDNQYAEIDITVINPSDYFGPAVRCGAAGSAEYYCTTIDDNTMYVLRGDGSPGSPTVLGTSVAAISATATIRCYAHDDLVYATVNGVFRVAFTDATYSSGVPGMHCFGAGTTSPARMGNFSAGNIADSNWEFVRSSRAGLIIVAATNNVKATRAFSSVVRRTDGTYDDDQFAEVTIPNIAINGEFDGAAVRCGAEDSAECYYCVMDDNVSQIVRGPSTVIASGGTARTGSVLVRAEAVSDEIRMYVDDIGELSVTDATYSTGVPGLSGFGSASATMRMDDWVGGDFGGSPATGAWFGVRTTQLRKGVRTTELLKGVKS